MRSYARYWLEVLWRSGRAWAWRCLPHSGGASRSGILARRLRAGGLVCLLCERGLTGSGIEVELFGEPAVMMGGPAALAVHARGSADAGDAVV